MIIQNRDIKQPPETKLFISSNHLVSDFEDKSASNNQITKYADVKTVNETSTTNPKYFPVGNDKGIYFDGAGDFLTLADSADWDLDANFTIDFWVYLTSTQDQRFLHPYVYVGRNYASYNISYTAGSFYISSSSNGTSSNDIMLASTPANQKEWYHIAFIRSGNSYKAYKNGIEFASSISANAPAPVENSLWIGGRALSPYEYANGFLQNIRITKGEALWTANFIPPALNSTYTTTANTKLYIKGHDKAVNTTAMTDDSGTSKTITTVGDTKAGYSRGVASYFDGTGDYLTCPRVDSGDYTKTTCVELWYHPIAVTNYRPLFQSHGGTNGAYVLTTNGAALQFMKWTTNANTAVYSATVANVVPTANKWYHIVVEWEAGTTSNGNVNFWINGVKSAVAKTSSISSYATVLSYIGFSADSGYTAVQGYISGLKITESAGSYASGNFTPPETEPVADQYTKLLLKQKMLAIRDNATNKAITIYGQTMSRNFARGGKNSIYFDGTDDRLQTPDSPDLEPGSGDFTIDLWATFTSLVPSATAYIVYGKFRVTGNQREYFCQLDQNELIQAGYTTDGVNSISMRSTASVSLNTWYHIAFVKSGSNIMLFVNGQLQETDTGVSTIYVSTSPLEIASIDASTTINHRGCIQDFRVTKKALWTSNFTPPRKSGAF